MGESSCMALGFQREMLMSFRPTDELYASKMGNAEPAKDRKPEVKSISGYHWSIIRDLRAGVLFDDRVLDAIDELKEAGLEHMI